MDRKQLALIAAICAGVVVIAMFLPVGKASSSGMPNVPGLKIGTPSASWNGFDAGGGLILAFLLAAAAGTASLFVFLEKTDAVPLDGRQLLFLGVGAFGLAALLVLITFLGSDYETRTIGSVTTGTSQGIGLYLMLIGSLAGGAACFLATKKAPVSSSGSGSGDSETKKADAKPEGDD